MNEGRSTEVNFSNRIAHLRPEGAYQVLARSRELEAEGKDILHLEIGEPFEETFPHIKKAGIRAIREGFTRYTPPAGMAALRQAIANHAGHQRGIEIDPGQVVVSPGAKPNLFFPTLALIQPGDEVLYPDPGFPTYPAMIGVAGGKAIPVPLKEENDFCFDMEAFQAKTNHHTKLIVLNSPSNPTGGVLPREDLETIAAAALDCDCWVLSDEIYSRLTYDGQEAPSIASLPGMAERTVIVDGVSKTYAMTGWRLGYGIMPKNLAHKVELLLTHSMGSTAQFTQMAAIQALTGSQDDVRQTLARYKNRREVLVQGLNKLPGVNCRWPQGAFYAFPNFSSYHQSSTQMAEHLLEKAGVAVLPGTAFGLEGEGYLRFCFANSVERLTRALNRIDHALRQI